MGYPVVHFEISSSSAPELIRFYAEAFGWEMRQDGDDYTQVRTNGVCAGTGAAGIDGGIATSAGGDDFVTFYVQVPDVGEALEKAVALGAEVDLPPTEAGHVVVALLRDPRGNRVGLVRG